MPIKFATSWPSCFGSCQSHHLRSMAFAPLCNFKQSSSPATCDALRDQTWTTWKLFAANSSPAPRWADAERLKKKEKKGSKWCLKGEGVSNLSQVFSLNFEEISQIPAFSQHFSDMSLLCHPQSLTPY